MFWEYFVACIFLINYLPDFINYLPLEEKPSVDDNKKTAEYKGAQ